MTEETKKRIIYSLDELQRIRNLPASKVWPSALSAEHKTPEGYWNPVAAYNVNPSPSFGRPRRKRLNTDGPRPKRNGGLAYMNQYVSDFSPSQSYLSPNRHYSMHLQHYYNYPPYMYPPRNTNWNSNFPKQDNRAVETHLLQMIKGNGNNSQQHQQGQHMKSQDNINKLRSQDPSILSISFGEGEQKLDKTNEIENYLKSMLLQRNDKENATKTTKPSNVVTLEEIERGLISDDVSACPTLPCATTPPKVIQTENLEHLLKMLQTTA